MITFLDQGAVGDGVADDSTALSDTLALGPRAISGVGPEYSYAAESPSTIDYDVIIDGMGATFKPVGDTQLFRRYGPSVTVSPSATIASLSQGARTFTVASSTGYAVGQWLHLAATKSGEAAYGYPDFWAKVTGATATTISVDRPLPVDYSAATTVECDLIEASEFLGFVHIKNCVFDGSACTYDTDPGQALRLAAVEKVILENCEFRNFDNNAISCQAFAFLYCIDVTVINNRMTGHNAQDQNGSVYFSRSGKFIGNTADGSAFGLSTTRCETAIFQGNNLYGRRKLESDTSVTPLHSARGIKSYGCAATVVAGNDISDYESPIKIEAGYRFDIVGNTMRNAGLSSYSGQIALNVGSAVNGTNLAYGIIANNIVENSGGAGIGVSSDTIGKVVITGNQVLKTQSIGIYAPIRNVVISQNMITDWGLRNSAEAGIYYGDGATVTDNRFSHATLTSLPCLRNNLTSGYRYSFSGNAVETANPLLPSSKEVETSGTATIPSGSTSVAVTHNLVKTPALAEIQVTAGENPTNAPGHIWVSGVGSTQFTINCAANPGASNLDVGWRAALKMPFTA
ncbi:MAG TPA: right-handed parallel beta-helix repeat-containing protein [Allosphingosinicella sp.]|nr:right-handed parallel beta-helix repeat-containing protein [Allosphingosinicella sp.]